MTESVIFFFFIHEVFILQQSYTDNSLWHFFKITYGILIGDTEEFKTEKEALDKELYFIVLFLASVYLVIIMLNLLIAIINNSFTNVLAKEQQNEIYEKLKIINNTIYEFTTEQKQLLQNKINKIFLFQLKTIDDDNETAEQQISKMVELQTALVSLTKKHEAYEKKVELQSKLNARRMNDMEENLINQMKNLFNDNLHSKKKEKGLKEEKKHATV